MQHRKLHVMNHSFTPKRHKEKAYASGTLNAFPMPGTYEKELI